DQPDLDPAGPYRLRRPGGDRLGDRLAEPFGAPGQADLARQQVDGAERQQRHRSWHSGEAIHHGIDRAVAAGGDDRLEIRLGLARQALDVAGSRGGPAQHRRAAAPLERGDHPEKAARGGSPSAGRRIDDDQHPAAHHPALARSAWPAMVEQLRPAPRRSGRTGSDGTMALLVTGCAGFIGFHVARHLLDRGEQVIGIDNLNPYYDVALKRARLAQLEGGDGFVFRPVDVADPMAVTTLVERHPDIDRIIHLAAQAGVRYSLTQPLAYVEANVKGQVVLLEAARRL